MSYSDLERLAKLAPWTSQILTQGGMGETEKDGNYISAASPEVILKLLEDLKVMKEALWPFANIHDKAIFTQELITGENSVIRARAALAAIETKSPQNENCE